MQIYTAKTLEELLQNAAEEKGVTIDELEYTVVEEKKGLLGIGNSVSAKVFSSDDVKEFIFDYLGEFFTHIDLDIEVALEELDDSYVINLNSDNNAILIGKMGKTLAAFNTVLRAAVNSERPGGGSGQGRQAADRVQQGQARLLYAEPAAQLRLYQHAGAGRRHLLQRRAGGNRGREGIARRGHPGEGSGLFVG